MRDVWREAAQISLGDGCCRERRSCCSGGACQRPEAFRSQKRKSIRWIVSQQRPRRSCKCSSNWGGGWSDLSALRLSCSFCLQCQAAWRSSTDHEMCRTSIGLGGKTLIDLERPAHLHASTIFPPHSFRPGDLASVVDHAAGGTKGKGRAAKEVATIEGVVWKVLETKIVVALNRGRPGTEGTKEEDTELPERIRLCVLLLL